MSTMVQHRVCNCRIRQFAIKGPLVLAILLVPTDHYPVVIDPWAQVAELTSSEGNLDGPVAIDGNTVVVGASGTTTTLPGAIDVFVKPAAGWANMTQIAKLTASDGDPFLGSGPVGVSVVGISGDTIVAAGSSAVYVFVKPAGGWTNMTETAKLTAIEPGAPTTWPVGIEGDTVVAGNPNASSGAGAAYVWAKPASGWANMTQTARLTASEGSWNPFSVSISDNAVVALSLSGIAVYVFVKPDSGWANMTETARLTAVDPQGPASLGFSVAISGNTVVAGSVSTAAYVWVKPEAGWANKTQTAKLTRSDQASQVLFGVSVAVSGNTVAVGAPYNTSGAPPFLGGAAYVFVEPVKGWINMTETAKLTEAAGSGFGGFTAVSGKTVVVCGAGNPNAAYVFQPSHVPGQTYTFLYNFTGGLDGSNPSAGLIQDARGNLYGTTSGGGRTGTGVVFKLDPTGKETVLHEFGFAARPNDGANPSAGLVRDAAGNLYGTTVNGGASGLGTIFQFTAKHLEFVLHSFAGTRTDGAHPYAGLIRDSTGKFYGTTSAGGAFGHGTVFKLAPFGVGKESMLYSFTGGADGANPSGTLVRDAAGILYGTTNAGGSSSCSGGCGVVFKIDTSGRETVIYSFTGGNDGANPSGTLLRDAAGNLYGTTNNGGTSGYRVVFKLETTGTETVLHNFAGFPTDGSGPYAVMRDPAGNFYGTTSGGGAFGAGVVFELETTGKETVLYSFLEFTGSTFDASNASGTLLRDAAGNLYGTAASGGDFNAGVVFKLTP
jgi:uncharacterized repeat protein (TIGR03803 family)